jgi:glucosamine kinase
VPYFAGIDGGQSATTAVIADEHGRIVARGTAGPADEVAQSAQSTRLRDALRDSLNDAIGRAGLPRDLRFEQIVAGVSGYEGRVYGLPPQLPTDALKLVHDAENAHAGALGGAPGAVVIAGTGSVGFARDERGSTAMVGGWGYLFGDEGSAFWIARTVLAEVMRNFDAGDPGELGKLARKHFAQDSLRAFARAFYANEISRAEIATFASIVTQAAERGNAVAARYVSDGAAALVNLAMRALARLSMPSNSKIAFTGGMMSSSAVREQVAQLRRRLLPSAQLVQPEYDGAVGALILAYDAAGVSPKSIAL